MFAHRFVWLALVLVTFMGVRSTAGDWTGDFWSHSAAVRELSERPFHPRHPEVSADLPGCFYTPYAVAVAWMARLGGLGPVGALAVAGVFNLALLLAGLRLYAGEIFRRPDAVSFYTVLFVLFLWGRWPWQWSAFFHFQVLPYVLPYPSAFATALMLVSLALHARWLSARGNVPLWLLFATSAIVPTTHPVTAVVLGLGLAAQTLGIRSERSWRVKGALLGALGLVALIVSAAWPYYPFFQMLEVGADYHDVHGDMYVDVWRKVWPALVALPCVAIRLRSNRSDPLALAFVGLVCLYIWGGLTGRFAYGRLVSHAVMVLHLSLAAWVAAVEGNRAALQPLSRRFALALVAAACLVAAGMNASRIRNTILDRPNSTSTYAFLGRYVEGDDVVLSDLASSYPVPTFAGKVVAHEGNLALVPDAAARVRDVDLFFEGGASADERAEIIERYNVRWLLLSRDHAATESLEGAFEGQGLTAHVDGQWVLIRLDDHRGRQSLAPRTLGSRPGA